MALCALHEGIENFILAEDNAGEAAVVKGLNILPARNIRDVINHINRRNIIKVYTVNIDEIFEKYRL